MSRRKQQPAAVAAAQHGQFRVRRHAVVFHADGPFEGLAIFLFHPGQAVCVGKHGPEGFKTVIAHGPLRVGKGTTVLQKQLGRVGDVAGDLSTRAICR